MQEIIITEILVSTLLFGSAIPISLSEIEAQEEAYFKQNDTYFFDKHDNVQVVEYVTPLGESGYQIIGNDKDGNKVSQGYGPEAASRTWNNIPVASSTPAE
jgi:hypothetical protein